MAAGVAATARTPVATQHPDFNARVDEWKIMRDTARGASAIYAAGGIYLPMPSGFTAQPDQGTSMYAAYQMRAQYPEIVAPTIGGMVGVICRVEPEITLPKELEYLEENSNNEGLPLDALHRKVVEEILTTGRYILLCDAPRDEKGGDPYLVGYVAEALINWSKDRDLFVLSEAKLVLDGFQWDLQDQWRVLRVSADGGYTQQVFLDDGQPSADGVIQIRARGNKPLDEIPVVVIGARDLDVSPGNPPLLGVARASVAIYRLDADYRHQLFMSGQETLTFEGVDEKFSPGVIGAGVIINLPKDAHGKYVSPTCAGISAIKEAINDDRQNAAALGAQVFDTSQKAGVESGDALRIRTAANTATLVAVALTAATGLEKSLRHAATMTGADPSKVVVKPNLSFLEGQLGSLDVLNLVKAWQSGGMSFQTLYENLQRGQVASTERTWEDEKELIESETPADFGVAPGAQPPASGDTGPPPGTEPDPGTFDPSLEN